MTTMFNTTESLNIVHTPGMLHKKVLNRLLSKAENDILRQTNTLLGVEINIKIIPCWTGARINEMVSSGQLIIRTKR